jgi:hypothetical protein
MDTFQREEKACIKTEAMSNYTQETQAILVDCSRFCPTPHPQDRAAVRGKRGAQKPPRLNLRSCQAQSARLMLQTIGCIRIWFLWTIQEDPSYERRRSLQL